MNINQHIKNKINKFFKKTNIKYFKNIYRITTNNNFNDYQINGLTNITKKNKIDQKFLFYKITEKLKHCKLINYVNTTKTGIINIILNKKEIENIVNKYAKKKNFGIKSKKTKNIIIDYSSPNIAKEMHIGHLRSTIIGDSIANILEFLGHKITRINHIGDWGIQFGIIIAWIKKKNIKLKKNISYLENIYIKARKFFKKNKEFSKKARKYVVKLQKKEPKTTNLWKKIVKITVENNQKIYNFLKIKLNNNNILGESFYQKFLYKIIKKLIKKKIIIKDKKAIIAFTKIKHKKNCLVIKNKEGGYLYSSTDLACIKYRCKQLKAEKIIYLTDFRQKQYLKSIFEISKKAKFTNKKTKLIHYYFGTILNKNQKPIKTRDGNNIKLKTLIKKAITNFKNNKKQKKKNSYNINHKLTISAIKYSDLITHRKKNYIFDWNKIFSFKGKTGPYIQYAYTRIISILKKNQINITEAIKNYKIKIHNKLEYKIIKELLNFEEIIIVASKKGTPHLICHYLHNLTTMFSQYYEKNNITYNKHKKSKLKLIAIIAKTIKTGLFLLGIPVLQKM